MSPRLRLTRSGPRTGAGKTLMNLANVEEHYQSYDADGEPVENLDGLRSLLTVLAMMWLTGILMRCCVTGVLTRARKVVRLLPAIAPAPPVGRPVHVVEGVVAPVGGASAPALSAPVTAVPAGGGGPPIAGVAVGVAVPAAPVRAREQDSG